MLAVIKMVTQFENEADNLRALTAILSFFVYTIGCWAILLLPEKFKVILPWSIYEEDIEEVPPRDNPESLLHGCASQRFTLEDIMPKPVSLHSAWKAGRILGRLESNGGLWNDDLLKDASQLFDVQVEQFDPLWILTMGDTISFHEQNRNGFPLEMISTFTVINIFWFVAVTGLSFTVWPFLCIAANVPLQWLLENIWIPVYPYLIKWELLWDLLLFCACFYLTCLSLCFKPKIRPGVGLLGLASASVVFMYVSNTYIFLTAAWPMTLFFTLETLAIFPLAKKYGSEMLGFLTVGFLFLSLDDWLIPSVVAKLLYRSADLNLQSRTVSSFLIALIPVCLKKCNLDMWCIPFRTGVLLFGFVIFHIELLMASSISNFEHGSFLSYLAFNAVVLLVLGGLVLIGYKVQFQTLSTISSVFLALWLFTKLLDSCSIFGDKANIGRTFFVFTGMLMMACILYRQKFLSWKMFDMS